MSSPLPAPEAVNGPVKRFPKSSGRLVVSRREFENVKIGDDIEIEILEIEGSTVRLAITAPKDVKILRSELVARLNGAA